MALAVRRLKALLHILLMVAVLVPCMASAQSRRDDTVVIRDAEIETTLKKWLAPLLKVAGIDPEGVKLILVQDSQINAFVAGGSNIFLYTGLIERTENPGELIGVMAHELGHIAGSHLIAGRAAAERASYESILGAVLGIGAALATGSGQAANAIMMGSNSLATNRYLSHSRLQESSADQAAIRFLNGAHVNPAGLVSFFEKLESEELLPVSQQSGYMRTHPLTRDRIDAVRVKVQASPDYNAAYPDAWLQEHARMKAKLVAFTKPQQISWIYGDNDKSVAARYAYAIADYRQNNIDKALKEIDALIAAEPDNAYFQELKGQMLMDFGRVAEAVPYYRKAVAAVPESGLLRMALGHALLESARNNPDILQEAIDQLTRALQDEPRATRIHRLLATAYGQLGQENRAKLHLAEEAVLQRRIGDAKIHARAVLETSPKDSREALKAKDILKEINNLKKSGDLEEEP